MTWRNSIEQVHDSCWLFQPAAINDFKEFITSTSTTSMVNMRVHTGVFDGCGWASGNNNSKLWQSPR